MLKAINTMANLIRPAADRRTTRHTRSRSPPPAEAAKQAALQQQPPPAPIPTRRPSNTLPPPADSSHAQDVAPPKQPSPARAGARKRPIAEVDTPAAQPQSKIKQRRSYDDLSTWANDATKKRHHGNPDDMPSGASTPRPVDAAHDTSSTMVDKKSLRSKNPVRKASELAEIFEDYDDIISKWEDGETTESSLSAIGSDDHISILDEPLTAAQREEFTEKLRKAAARARTDRPPPNPNHAYTKRAPFDYTPYANALPTTEDPLADSVYKKVHNRHEGVERKSRNRERDNLQYKMSKAQPVLEELEGEDWHKVFVIDKSEREAWEAKRRYFTKELRTAIAKQDALRDIELKKRRREKEKRAREKETPSSGGSSDETEHPIPKRPPRRPRPSPHPSPPHPRRPPRPHGFLLDYTPAPAPPSPFKSFYPKGQRPSSLSSTTGTTTGTTPRPPSSSRATRSADAPPFGVPLPALLARVDDARLIPMLRDDNRFAALGQPTEDVLLDDERSFQVFALRGGFVTGEFLRENERRRRRRKREREGRG